MFKILGVDPGSNCTGYGVISREGQEVTYLDSGFIALRKKESRYQKLRIIFEEVRTVIERFEPTHFAIEDVFYSKNPRSSLVLGEARGASILAAALAGLPIHEYSAREVKQSVTGQGGADKGQVAFMMGRILSLREPPANADESDALAIAICHAFKLREWSIL